MPIALHNSRAGVRTARQASVHGMTMLEWRSGRKNTLELQWWALHPNQEKLCVPRLIAGCTKGLLVVTGISYTKEDVL